MEDRGEEDAKIPLQSPHWTVYATLALTGVLVLLDLVPYLTHAVVPWYEAALGALIIGALAELLLAVGVIRLRRPLALDKPPTPVVSSELLNRWKTMRDRVWVAFAAQDRIGSMLLAESDILGMLNGEHNGGRLSPTEDGSRERAFAAKGAYGWLVAHTALGWAHWLLEKHALSDATAFGAAMEIVQTVATEGRNAADAWVEMARQAGVEKLGNQGRDKWGRFRDPANLVLSDLGTLASDTYREANRGIPYRLELIRDL